MSAVQIEVGALFEALSDRVLLDVRTPAEYEKGHIPGALNLPLFSNEERVEVGTTYKQVDPRQALLKGLDFVGSKMRFFVEEADHLAPGGKLLVHCWRGGKRSESMAWLLRLAGFDVLTLKGGYKAYRNYILDWFTVVRHQLLILGGYTGSGKTSVLRELAQMGENVVDLERLANHKGSAFGALGEPPQPSVEQFENDLFKALSAIDAGKRVWLENESRAIGRVYIPESFWRQMMAAPLIHLDMPTDLRVERLLADYACFAEEALAASFEKISRRLGGQNLQSALDALRNKDLEAAARIALGYYDKTYHHGLAKRSSDTVLTFPVNTNDSSVIAPQLLKFVKNEFHSVGL